MKVLFIDRDGTLIDEPADFQVDNLAKIRFKAGVIPALRALQAAGFILVMVSNQDGLGSTSFPMAAFQSCQDFILDLLLSQGIVWQAVLICPHRANDGCACRKPRLSLLSAFLKENTLDLAQSWVIGDRDSDREFAENLGVSFMQIGANQDWPTAAACILAALRTSRLSRQTRETSLEVRIELDSDKPNAIDTPIPFFSHLLDQTATHGRFHLTMRAQGDVEVDEHHLIEDTALVLGQALRQALPSKAGIGRYGFTLPMDESLASIALDLSGRPFCRFKGRFSREYVGNMATEMVAHFFKSFADGLQATLHIQTQGENHHHMIEACFKVLGRALRQAMQQTGGGLPSTKGVL